jgi:glycerol-3-phosphate dehydrogenase (NAD(P)+)
MPFDHAFIVGGGAFGTSIASVLSQNFRQVIITDKSEEICHSIQKGENPRYFPGEKLPANISAVLSWEELEKTIAGKLDLIVVGIPSHAVPTFINDQFVFLRNRLKAGVPVVSLTKGIDPETLELPDDLYAHYYGDFFDLFTFLSGPSFAREIVEKQITTVSLAGRSRKTLGLVREMLQTPYFKVLPCYDVKGVLLGGALKNIIAIAGGIIEGLGYNHNTRAALITRGITEMLRFGQVFNARPETFYGLSGMGDLILTTTGELSRNKLFGLRLAKGESPQEILASGMLVEGYKTTLAAHRLAEKYGIRTTILHGLYQVLYENRTPQEVIGEIMEMTPRSEID